MQYVMFASLTCSNTSYIILLVNKWVALKRADFQHTARHLQPINVTVLLDAEVVCVLCHPATHNGDSAHATTTANIADLAENKQIIAGSGDALANLGRRTL